MIKYFKQQRPGFSILAGPGFGENKSLGFGINIKPRKWDFMQKIDKTWLLNRN